MASMVKSALGPDKSKQPGKAMIQSARRDRRAKAIAEVLAMIAYAQHPLKRQRPLPIRNADDRLSQTATEFRAALVGHCR
jgi:hypothetical protein